MHTDLAIQTMATELRSMAAQILSPDTGKKFFLDVANQLEQLRSALSSRQHEEGKAHALFHEPLPSAPEIDWATLHGPSEDGPLGFVRILRDHLSLTRAALNESLKLQSHYANLLNQWDGGQRRGFKDSEEWINRLYEVGTLKRPKIFESELP